MPKKITVTEDDGSVTEISETAYAAMMREAASAVLSTPEFEETLKGKMREAASAILATPEFEGMLKGMMDKIGDEVAKRFAAVEKRVDDQGEKIQRLEEKVANQGTQIRDNESKVKDLVQEVTDMKKNFLDLSSKSTEPLSVREPFEPISTRELYPVNPLGGRNQLFSKPSPLDACPDPSNLKDEFRSLLQAKHKNRKQIVIGPVLSKENGDGFLDKDNLNPLQEDEVSNAIRAVGVSGPFCVTVTNPEKRMARVRFEGQHAETACETVIASWRLLRDEFAMWAGPDQPVDLSKMIVNAKKFGIALRADTNLSANAYVDVKDGILFIGAIRIAPVYLIPDPLQWPIVSPIVVEEIKSNLSKPWALRKVCSGSSSLVAKIWDAVWKDKCV